MRLMLNNEETVTIQCNHVEDPAKAHSFTFTNYGGDLYGREFNTLKDRQKYKSLPNSVNICLYCVRGKTSDNVCPEECGDDGIYDGFVGN